MNGAEVRGRRVSGVGLKAGSDRAAVAGLRVLLVDDSAVVREVTDRMLRALGCLSSPHEFAEDAVGAVLRNRSGYDVIVSDVDMPGMSGWQLLEAVRALAGSTPAVVLSSGRHVTPPPGCSCAPDAVLDKPYGMRELCAVLAAASAHTAPRDERNTGDLPAGYHAQPLE